MGNFGSKLCGKGCLSSDEGKACVEVDTRVPSRKQPSHTAPATALSKKDEELCQSPGINELSIEFTGSFEYQGATLRAHILLFDWKSFLIRRKQRKRKD